MKQHLSGILLYGACCTVVFFVLLFVIRSGAALWYVLQNHASAFSVSQTTYVVPISQYSHTSPHLTVGSATPTPGAQPAGQIDIAQNDLSIANSLLTWAGVFIAFILAVVTLIAAVAGFFGFRELRNIRDMRDLMEKRLQNVTDLEAQLKEQGRQLDQRFESDSLAMQRRVEQFESSSQGVKERLAELVEQLERESQILVEVSYNFSQGISFYRAGDNVHAVECYHRALKLQPNNIRVMERLGKAYHYLNDIKHAIFYLEDALSIDPNHVATLRSLALCYREIDKEKAIKYLHQSLILEPNGFEALDYLGLFHRDLGKIDEAIEYHEKALAIKQRPETEFYLSILHCCKGDKRRAELMAFSADVHSYQQEHDERMRPVWKYLIRASYCIVKGQKNEALRYLHETTKSITVQHLYDAVMVHLQLLLDATDNSTWLPECQKIIQIQEVPTQRTVHLE